MRQWRKALSARNNDPWKKWDSTAGRRRGGTPSTCTQWNTHLHMNIIIYSFFHDDAFFEWPILLKCIIGIWSELIRRDQRNARTHIKCLNKTRWTWFTPRNFSISHVSVRRRVCAGRQALSLLPAASPCRAVCTTCFYSGRSGNDEEEKKNVRRLRRGQAPSPLRVSQVIILPKNIYFSFWGRCFWSHMISQAVDKHHRHINARSALHANDTHVVCLLFFSLAKRTKEARRMRKRKGHILCARRSVPVVFDTWRSKK